MYGVTAIRRRAAAGGTPPWLPDGALAHLDFVNGQYYADGAERSILTILGGAFDPDDIGASGMAVWTSNANRPTAIGALADVIEAGLASGMTVICEAYITGEGTSGSAHFAPIALADTDDFSTATWELNVYAGIGTGWAQIEDFNAVDLFSDHSFDDDGINRWGFTISRDIGGGSYRYAATMNGEAAGTDTVAYAADANFPSAGPGIIAVGHAGNDGRTATASYIRTLTIYAAVDETELAALTELPTA